MNKTDIKPNSKSAFTKFTNRYAVDAYEKGAWVTKCYVDSHALLSFVVKPSERGSEFLVRDVVQLEQASANIR